MESRERKIELDRMAAILSRLGKRGYSAQEEPGIDFDSDSDFDPEKINSRPAWTRECARISENERFQ